MTPAVDLSGYKTQGKARPCPDCDRRRKTRSARAYVGKRCRRWVCVCPVHGVVRERTW